MPQISFLPQKFSAIRYVCMYVCMYWYMYDCICWMLLSSLNLNNTKNTNGMSGGDYGCSGGLLGVTNIQQLSYTLQTEQ